ncbi:hypothetical protein O987_15070 [Comamonas testosteroni TK102]|uniref:Uncharacterized protein n=1 Tax=Comamonas testosteroni TK102 TaxID=1392005 RepID=A0A076PUV8_COMTE|nr:hypothetical protein O987_15070 [Comamonas testosteroni TK102]
MGERMHRRAILDVARFIQGLGTMQSILHLAAQLET